MTVQNVDVADDKRSSVVENENIKNTKLVYQCLPFCFPFV